MSLRYSRPIGPLSHGIAYTLPPCDTWLHVQSAYWPLMLGCAFWKRVTSSWKLGSQDQSVSVTVLLPEPPPPEQPTSTSSRTPASASAGNLRERNRMATSPSRAP